MNRRSKISGRILKSWQQMVFNRYYWYNVYDYGYILKKEIWLRNGRSQYIYLSIDNHQIELCALAYDKTNKT